MRKIAVIQNSWGKNINYDWTLGLKQYIAEHNLDVNIYIFNSFGNYSMDEKYDIGEYNITSLANFSDYDGLILELTNIGDMAVKQSIIQRAKESGVPTVSLIEDLPEFYHSGADNYSAVTELVEHLITEHGCRTFGYIGGPRESNESHERYRAFTEALARHGIQWDDRRSFWMNYEIATGERAYEYFKERDMIPEAFVCANDFISFGLCHSAQEDGYVIPDDFLVTGFDNIEETAHFSPAITTTGYLRRELAYNAIAILAEIWDGGQPPRVRYAHMQPFYRESCGCRPEQETDSGSYIVERIFAEENESRLQSQMMELKRALINCVSFKEMAYCLPTSLPMLQYDEFYILVNRDIVECATPQLEIEQETDYPVHGYPEDMVVLLAMMKDFVLTGLKRKKGKLIPGDGDDGCQNVFLFLPLHFRDREVGYFILKNCEYMMETRMIYEVLNMFLETMENLHHRMILSRMNQELSELYLKDSLTGLYNRMAYGKLAVPMFNRCMTINQPIMVMFVDMDRLKYINDNYGHDTGNTAIKAITAAILAVFPKNAISMRYGGDEFVILVPDCSKEQGAAYAQKLEAQITEMDHLVGNGVPIGASVGYYVAEDASLTLNDAINIADERMYANKRARKMDRR